MVQRWRAMAMGMAMASMPGLALAETLSFQDPKGDDDGTGKTTYPTDKAYTPSAFDLTGLEIREDGDHVVFEVELAAPLTDPWNSKEWNGNGFSVQFVQIYLDLDGKPRKGERKAVPGAWVEFAPDSYWEKVVLISPQPNAKLIGEIDGKARWLKKQIVLPDRTEARGKKLIARVPIAEIGKPSKSWGVQALMLSNEGFPAAEDLLARRVNENPGDNRFGGGCDGLGDPQVLDLLAGKGKAEATEAEAQHKALAAHTCAEDPKKAKLAVISMVRP